MCQVFRQDNDDNQLVADFAFFPNEFHEVSCQIDCVIECYFFFVFTIDCELFLPIS